MASTYLINVLEDKLRLVSEAKDYQAKLFLLFDYFQTVENQPKLKLIVESYVDVVNKAIEAWEEYKKSQQGRIQSLAKRYDKQFPEANATRLIGVLSLNLALKVKEIASNPRGRTLSRYFQRDDSAEHDGINALYHRACAIEDSENKIRKDILDLYHQYHYQWRKVVLQQGVSGGVAYLQARQFCTALLGNEGLRPLGEMIGSLLDNMWYVDAVKLIDRQDGGKDAQDAIDRAVKAFTLLHHRLKESLVLTDSWRQLLVQYQRRCILYDRKRMLLLGKEPEYARDLAMYMLDRGHLALTEVALGESRLDVVGADSKSVFVVEAKLVTKETTKETLLKAIETQCARYLNDFAEGLNIRAIFLVIFRKDGKQVFFNQEDFWFGGLQVVTKVINIGDDKASDKTPRKGAIVIDRTHIKIDY